MRDFKEQFEDIRQRYAAQLTEKVDRLAAGWLAVEAAVWDAAVIGELQRQAHSLAGSGGTFGFASVAAAARDLELALGAMAHSTEPAAAKRAQLTAMVCGLQELVATRSSASVLTLPAVPQGQPGGRVYIVDDDVEQAEGLAMQIAHFGYETRVFARVDELLGVDDASPNVVVLDLRDSVEQGDAITLLHAGRATPIPLVFTSQRTDFAARLQAVRAGGRAYFPKPIDVGALVDELDQLTDRQRPEPYRVLIVDDSPFLAEAYAAILGAAGMRTTVAIEPTDVSGLLVEHQPDLILMDMYMPVCDGHELAAVIRQQPEFHSIPIVFLSAETDRSTQLAALHRGGDDFLTKPITADHLIAAVTSRIQRARVMRGQMLRDSLTGLLNHSVTKDQLAREVARARRNGSALSMVLLDLDHFKQVNDRHGHAAGDRVLKSMARLLQQRLRITDVIGRYGGEEFAVIMPDTDGATALAVLEEIRIRFSQVRHRSGSGEFHVTLSGGVAALPPFGEAAYLSECADIALYQAKGQGRNQLVLASRPGDDEPAVSHVPAFSIE